VWARARAGSSVWMKEAEAQQAQSDARAGGSRCYAALTVGNRGSHLGQR
jgi:hypothetical protein